MVDRREQNRARIEAKKVELANDGSRKDYDFEKPTIVNLNTVGPLSLEQRQQLNEIMSNQQKQEWDETIDIQDKVWALFLFFLLRFCVIVFCAILRRF